MAEPCGNDLNIEFCWRSEEVGNIRQDGRNSFTRKPCNWGRPRG